MQKGELYGGSMFARSASLDQKQGQAIHQINEKWGQLMPRNKRGRETIGIAVCKKKYAPFRFTLDSTTGVVHTERMYGCPCHSALRKTVIAEHGERPGWEPFGQWSLRKAQDICRKETARLALKTNDEDETDWEESSSSSSDSTPTVCNLAAASCEFDNKSRSTTLCMNGNCLWKVKSAYDDIQEEMERQAYELEVEQQTQQAENGDNDDKEQQQQQLDMTSDSDSD